MVAGGEAQVGGEVLEVGLEALHGGRAELAPLGGEGLGPPGDLGHGGVARLDVVAEIEDCPVLGLDLGLGVYGCDGPRLGTAEAVRLFVRTAVLTGGPGRKARKAVAVKGRAPKGHGLGSGSARRPEFRLSGRAEATTDVPQLLGQGEICMLQLTGSAVQVVQETRSRQGFPEHYGVRVYLGRGAEAGIRLGFAEGPGERDQVAESGGTRIFVAPEIAEPLAAATIDAKETDQGKRLVLRRGARS